MNKIFKNKLTFENFTEIFKFICSQVELQNQNTDVSYRFGCLGGGSTDIPNGQFKLRAKRDEIVFISQDAQIIEPFKREEGARCADEYFVLIIRVKATNGKAKFVFIRRGHLGAFTNDRFVTELPIEFDEETITLLFLLDYRSALVGVGAEQGHYHFDAPFYGKNGEIILGYSHWYRRIDDRD